MGWNGNIAPMGERRDVYLRLVENPEGRTHFGEPGVDEKFTIKWIFRK
jgi:hypothetical protein